MMQLVERELRIQGKNLTWLANELDTTTQNVNNWKTRGIPARKVKPVADAIKVAVAWLESDGQISNVELIAQQENRVPLISWIQAGNWGEAIDEFQPGDAEYWLPAVGGSDKVYCLRVRGDSMTSQYGDSFPEGHIIWIDPEQRSPNNNDYVVAKLNGEDAVTFKQYKIDETDRPYLKPLNQSHNNIFDEFRVIGRVIWAGRKF